MRKSFHRININFKEFDALILLTSEMAKFLYPYTRAILSSKDNYGEDPQLWNDFHLRYTQLIEERFNIESIKVKKLIDQKNNQILSDTMLMNLALCSTEEGFKRLNKILLNL